MKKKGVFYEMMIETEEVRKARESSIAKSRLSDVGK